MSLGAIDALPAVQVAVQATCSIIVTSLASIPIKRVKTSFWSDYVQRMHTRIQQNAFIRATQLGIKVRRSLTIIMPILSKALEKLVEDRGRD